MKQIAAVAVSLLCAEGAMAQDFAAALMTELTRSCPSGQPSRGEQAGPYFFVFGQSEIRKKYDAYDTPEGLQGPYGHIIPLEPPPGRR
jgi:hypothetical protein